MSELPECSDCHQLVTSETECRPCMIRMHNVRHAICCKSASAPAVPADRADVLRRVRARLADELSGQQLPW